MERFPRKPRTGTMWHVAPSFTTADYLVFVASLLISLGIGFYHWFRSRHRDTKDFLMGGGRMSPIPVSLSFAAGVISAVSILGNPTEMYYYGSQFSMNIIGLMIGTVFFMAVIMPVIYPLNLISLYGYLEYRWGSKLVRKLASVLELFNLIVIMGVTLYAPSLAISSVTPITTNTSVLVMGLVCGVYASLGGAKAVVYTDSFQMAVMITGVITVIVQGCAEVGGGTASWAIAAQNDRLQFFNESTDPLERNTLMNVIVLGVYIVLGRLCFSQAQFQRWGSVSSLSQSYLVIVLGVAGIVGMISLINYAGLVLYSVYADCDPFTAGYIDKEDQVLMYFVADKLGYLPGIPGLFVAAICSGGMSSVSSIITAVSAIVWKDFLEPMSIFDTVSEKAAKNINIMISACAGVVAVGVGVLAGSLGGIVQVAYTLEGAFRGPLSGIFLTTLLCPWSVFLASLMALTLTMWVALGSFLYAPTHVMLPLYVDGCRDPGFNSSTTIASISTTLASSTYVFPRDDDVFPLYKLSHCLYGAIGILATIVLSTVLSCFIGFESPANVPVSSVNRTCLRFYCWLRREEMQIYVPEAASPNQTHPDDAIVIDLGTGGPTKLHYEPVVMMKPQCPISDAPCCDNPVPVDDLL